MMEDPNMGQIKITIRGDLLRSSIAAAATLIAMTCLHAADPESSAPARVLPRIKVSPNGRFLITENRKPFFWLADTGWWMTGISPAEVDVYLEKRAKQQFNVIQFHCGRLVKDYAGRLPFRGNDALAPDEEYWRNIDSIVSGAARPHSRRLTARTVSFTYEEIDNGRSEHGSD